MNSISMSIHPGGGWQLTLRDKGVTIFISEQEAKDLSSEIFKLWGLNPSKILSSDAHSWLIAPSDKPVA